MTNEVSIIDLKELANLKDQQAIIAFCVERDGTVRCVTYGEDTLKCKATGWWGQGLLKSKNISAIPFQTVFGMDNGGVPTPLMDSDYSRALDLVAAGKVPREIALAPLEG